MGEGQQMLSLQLFIVFAALVDVIACSNGDFIQSEYRAYQEHIYLNRIPVLTLSSFHV